MLFTVLSGLITSSLIVPFGRLVKSKWGLFLAILPLSLFCYFLVKIPIIGDGTTLYSHKAWVPSLGINLDFRLDGLSLLFSLLITGIGAGIFVYAFQYLKGHPYIDRFYGYLLLFMSAMLGVVLSDNIMLTFVFWELTSISSFFLIGFNNNAKASRSSALISLSVTALGGFFLLAGFVIIGKIAGTYQITELLLLGNIYQDHQLYPLIIAFIAIGAFTKSAQFPFHFWLPGAMKAPTPVSAYLHSATMVKAGIFLLARFTPIIGGTDIWKYTLLIVGGITMVYASINALLRIDLKSILAYSTISALGLLTFLIGLGTHAAFVAAASFIVAHALYKATLFMVAGVIDLKTGTRDITKLSGLGRFLPIIAFAGILAALSSAGLPSSLGFISKDLVYESTLNLDTNYTLFLTVAAVVANVGLVAAGFMAGIRPFVGSEGSASIGKTTLDYKLWLPPLTLAILSFVFGLAPSLISAPVIDTTVFSILGVLQPANLALWHGFNTVFLLSIATLALGTLVYWINRPSANTENFVEKLYKISPKFLFSQFVNAFEFFSLKYTNFFHDGFLRSYLFKIILFAELLLAYILFKDGPIYLDYSLLSSINAYEIVNIVILCGAIMLTIFTSSRLTAVVATSVIGYSICLMYVFYSAPDLAMTQFSIDTLTVVLFVFVLFRLPPFLNFGNTKIKVRDSVVAIGFGTLVSLTVLKVMQQPSSTDIKDFYGTYAYALAKGKNVVNVILVDFRGFDTMFEIVVLSIAGLGVYSLLKLRLKPSERE